jgi:hypothetical protein
MRQFLVFMLYAFFWWSVSVLTDRKKKAVIAYLINCVPNFYVLFSDNTIYGETYWFISNISFIGSLAYFGCSYFQNVKGLWLILMLFIRNGLFISISGISSIEEAIDTVFWSGFSKITLPIYYADICILPLPKLSILSIIMESFLLPLLLIAFWGIFSKIQNFGKLDWKF